MIKYKDRPYTLDEYTKRLGDHIRSPEYYLEMILLRFSQQDFSSHFYTYEVPTYTVSDSNPLYGLQEERKIVWSHIDSETGEVAYKERGLQSFLQAVFPYYDKLNVNYQYNFRKVRNPNSIAKATEEEEDKSRKRQEPFIISTTLCNVAFVIERIYSDINTAKVNPFILEYASFTLQSILLYIRECCDLTDEEHKQIDSIFSQLIRKDTEL